MITFDQIETVNRQIKDTVIKVNKKEKNYKNAREYIKAFRMICPNGSITTEILFMKEDSCVVRATVTDENGFVIGSGMAQEYKGEDGVNARFFVENCETSAVRRALMMCGIGIESSDLDRDVAAELSGDNSVMEARERERIISYLKRHKYTDEDIRKICNLYKVDSINKLNLDQCRHYIEFISKNGGNIDE